MTIKYGMMNNGVNPLAGWVAFTLYIGAARADATQSQLEQLRKRVPFYLDDIRLGTGAEAKVAMIRLLNTVSEIMGQRWQPRGEWHQWIKKLLDGDGKSGTQEEKEAQRNSHQASQSR